MRALLSVYDKTGLTGFARGLSELGVELIASGGTARELADASIDHIEVGDVTGVPEMLSGRVKTLHPGIHGGILADLDDPSHRRDLEAHAIEPIGLVVCNLYPFDARPSVEMIDIGGPAMVRAAAKNHARVAVVVDPAEYEPVLAALRQNGEIDARYRARLARAAFALTASYDAAVTRWLEAREVVLGGGLEEGSPASTSSLPSNLNLSLDRCQQLRYGENPHQKGAFYRLRGAGQGWLEGATRHGGRELSYLNLFDADAAWRLCAEVAELADPVLRRLRAGLSPTRAAAVVVKHANPCGVALGRDGLTAYELAVEADRTSAFGGTVALSVPVDAVLADLIAAGPLADVLVAPGFSPDAVQVFGSKRKNMRVLAAPAPFEQALSLRGVDGGFLVQETDRLVAGRETWRIVTAAEPSPSQWADLQLAWVVCARTSSNAVVVAKDGVVLGVGAGQQNRLDAARIAAKKSAGRASGGAGASDAFFPFRDGLDALVESGTGAIVQPGGSVHDQEVIEAADELGVAMVFTGERHFRH